MQKFLHQGLYWSKVVVLGVVLGVGIQFAEAWTNPTVSAPGGNVDGPLNTGVINQVKNASLGLVGNLSAWMLQPNAVVVAGSACPAGAVNGLLARDAAGIILSCQSGVWKSALADNSGLLKKSNYKEMFANASFGRVGSTEAWGTVNAAGDTLTLHRPCTAVRLTSTCTINTGDNRIPGPFFCMRFGSPEIPSIDMNGATMIIECGGEIPVHVPWN